MSSYTVCFCGTACARDEGETDRNWKYKLISKSHEVSNRKIFDSKTGYIPVRIHRDISGDLRNELHSVTVRGVGENDWSAQQDASDPLRLKGLAAPSSLHKDYASYGNGSNQRTLTAQANGWGATALALHAANLAATAAQRGATVFNFLGHSRGAVAALMAAWFLRAYGGNAAQIPINIFAIDPVPGTGRWYSILTQLPSNVRNYVGVYAWDHLDTGFSAVVPRPNAAMIQRSEQPIEEVLGSTWDTLADKCQLDDPLGPNPKELDQPARYRLYACRGRHGTVAGIVTSDGLYDASRFSENVAPVPRLVYKLARAYLTDWGTVFKTRSGVLENAKTLRVKIHTSHMEFDAMASGEARTSRVWGRLNVRQISSTYGRNMANKYYMEDVVGDPPYRLAYPCTIERKGRGWVDWKFL